MPSEASRADMAMNVVQGPIETFQTALVLAVEDVRSFLSGHRAPDGNRAQEVAAQLGSFGSGRIDADRFASLLTVPETLDAERLHRVEKALSHLEALATRGDDLYRAKVPRGGDLRDVVAQALATVGGAFAMVRVVATARDGRTEPLDPGDFVDGLPIGRWGRSERKMAPPLVVDVRGEDLVTGGLADFLEGGLEIVLVVDGPAPPAPLAPLITPDVFVAQTTNPEALASLVAFDGPAAAALMPEGAAEFEHDPSAGSSYATRLTLHHTPAGDSPARVGRISAFRQSQDLAHLVALSESGVPMPAPAGESFVERASDQPGSGEVASPADRLAGWLIQQAQLTDVS